MKITSDDIPKIVDKLAELDEREKLKTLLKEGDMRNAVIICNREIKHELKSVLPNLFIINHDACPEDRIYIITDDNLVARLKESDNEKN